jgi:hypothetical protein
MGVPMGPWDRMRLWWLRKRSGRITLGAIPLPSLIPDAAAALGDIYGRHRRQGYRVQVHWDVLVLDANDRTYRMQFYPVVSRPQDCLALGLRRRHLVRFIPVVSDPKELDELRKGLLGMEAFERTFTTDPMLMDPRALEALDRKARKQGAIKVG